MFFSPTVFLSEPKKLPSCAIVLASCSAGPGWLDEFAVESAGGKSGEGGETVWRASEQT